MNIKYILHRLSFPLEIRGIVPKSKLFLDEVISLMNIKVPLKGTQTIKWIGPHGDLILNYYDSIVCWRSEILDDKLYNIELNNKKNPIILDIGANQGFVTLWFKYNYPDAMIYAYEPMKKSYDILCKNVEDNNLNNCVLINAGVFDKNIEQNIYFHPGGAGLGDTISPIDPTGWDSTEIQLLNIDPTFEDTEIIDLVKMDIEGAEYNILKNCNFWKKSDKMIIEFHDNHKEFHGFKDVDFIKLIESNGFKLDKQVGTNPTYVCYFSKKDIYPNL